MVITKSIFYFILAGVCEIGGGYFVWLWLREIDKVTPDKYDIGGGFIALVGVGIMMYWPR